MIKKRRLSKVEKRQRRNALAQRRATAATPPMRVPYAAYLASDLWKDIRARVLARDNYLCQACFNKAEQVHHKDYKQATKQGECLDGLISLCRSCHVKIEFNGKQKNCPKRANAKLRELMRQRWVEVMAKHQSPPPATTTTQQSAPDRAQ